LELDLQAYFGIMHMLDSSQENWHSIGRKLMKTIAALLLALGATASLSAQTFQDLDFESATVSNLPLNQFGGANSASVTNAFPGWSAYIGTNQLSQVGHNVITLGATSVSLLGPQYAPPYVPLQGNYSATLQAGNYLDGPLLMPASIAQTGLIPVGAKFMRFLATFPFNTLEVAVGGLSTPYVSLGGNSYVCDVSAFANQIQEIRFTMNTNIGNGLTFVDAVSFIPALGAITSVAKEGSNIRITWQTSPGTTNMVQVGNGPVNGNYSTNFTDLGSPLAITGSGIVSTNYLDVGGATNTPARYYRVRLVP
jgi:hypothetical protein